jgi:hypothetical protein
MTSAMGGTTRDEIRRGFLNAYRDWAKVLGVVAGVAATFKLLHRLYQFPLADVFKDFVALYQSCVTTPIRYVLATLGLHLPEIAVDGLVVWILIGGLFARTYHHYVFNSHLAIDIWVWGLMVIAWPFAVPLLVREPYLYTYTKRFGLGWYYFTTGQKTPDNMHHTYICDLRIVYLLQLAGCAVALGILMVVNYEARK